MSASLSGVEARAFARWRLPEDTALNRFLTAFVVALSRFVMRGMNSLTIEGAERFEALLSRGDRGLLTFSNHVSLFDDPLLTSNLPLPPYPQLRWVASDAINFFGSPWKAFIFRAGKCVPIVRGAGLDQPGFEFLCNRLREGAWVHIFPEGGRTRDARALVSHPFKPGIGKLMAESRPLALPFYHYGMQHVLPVGSMVPRWRKRVSLVFGKPMDCVELLDSVPVGASGLAMWEGLAEKAYEALRELEVSVHPAAGGARTIEGTCV